MTQLNRRSILAGVAIVPAVGLCVPETPIERVQRLGKELEQAMLEAYGPGKLATCTWGPHATNLQNVGSPVYMVAVHPSGRPA
jgi:hypothetical protein